MITFSGTLEDGLMCLVTGGKGWCTDTLHPQSESLISETACDNAIAAVAAQGVAMLEKRGWHA